jgi:hypothetical protein
MGGCIGSRGARQDGHSVYTRGRVRSINQTMAKITDISPIEVPRGTWSQRRRDRKALKPYGAHDVCSWWDDRPAAKPAPIKVDKTG